MKRSILKIILVLNLLAMVLFSGCSKKPDIKSTDEALINSSTESKETSVEQHPENEDSDITTDSNQSSESLESDVTDETENFSGSDRDETMDMSEYYSSLEEEIATEPEGVTIEIDENQGVGGL